MKSMPIVYKATRITNRNRFEMFTCINPKMASKVDEALNRSAFFMSFSFKKVLRFLVIDQERKSHLFP